MSLPKTSTSSADNSENHEVAHALMIPSMQLAHGFPKRENLLTLDMLDAHFAEFLDYSSSVKAHSNQTINWYRGSYSSYRRYLVAGSNLAPEAFAQRAFNIDEWIRWNHQRNVETITINSYWRAMRAFFTDWEKRSGGPNPFRGLKAPKVRSYLPKALGYDECARIMLGTQNYPWRTPFERALAIAVLGIMLYAGLRVGEVRRLLVSDVNLREGTLRVTKGKGYAGGKDRIAYMAPELVNILREYLQERFRRGDVQPEFFVTASKGVPLGLFPIHHMIKCVQRASGVRFSAHVLRHSFVTHLLRSGAPVHVVRDLAGHANLATTMGYLNVFDEDRRESLKNLHFLGNSAIRRRSK